MMNNPRLAAYAGIVLTTFFWGTNFNAGAHIIKFMPPITAATERFVMATMLIFIIFGFHGKLRISTLKQNARAFFALGFFGVVGFNMAMFFGLHTTSPINGALIMATTPISTLALAYLFENERLTLFKSLGLLLGLFGVMLVISKGDLLHLMALKVAVGDVIILAGGLSFSLTTIISRRFVKQSTPLETTSFSMLLGSGMLLILALFFEAPVQAIQQAPWSAHLALIYLAVFGSMVAYVFWFNGIKYFGSSKAASFFNLVPVFTMLVSVALGVFPNIWQVVGTLIVIIGVMLSVGLFQLQFTSQHGIKWTAFK